ncbi:MAG: DUF1361 domain-containing protein [Leptospiraceae bacterium]|nr:DUF1361 domain-containing protein [Leptospiraceae bacterium]
MTHFYSGLRLFYGQIFVLFTVFNLLYLLIVSTITGNSGYNFLVWNLFLGFLPYLIVIVLKLYTDRLNLLWLLFGSFIWLLFYPNTSKTGL